MNDDDEVPEGYWERTVAALKLGGPELSFTGMGEALLHPDFNEMLRYARYELPGVWFLMETNGLALGEYEIKALRDTGTTVFVSTHRPEVAGPAIELCKQYGVEVRVNTNFAHSGFDWAGQVQWANSAPRTVCQYLAQGWGTVLENGNIVNCCMDAHGLYPYRNVLTSAVDELEIAPIPLCESCHLTVPEKFK